MGTTQLSSLSLTGIHCEPVEIEVDVSQGLPACIIVGLPDTAVSEARDRVRSAMKNSGYRFPGQRVTVNLAPAHTKKSGSLFDLPIALGMIAATTDIIVPEQVVCVGELALDGRLRAVEGVLALVEYAVETLGKTVIIPRENAQQAALLKSKHVLVAERLQQVVEYCAGRQVLQSAMEVCARSSNVVRPEYTDFSNIVGQPVAKRALEIAAAGKHHVLCIGSPGVGKSVLAHAFPSILPPLTRAEQVSATLIHSAAGQVVQEVIGHPPFLAPHHTASTAAILGGGPVARPGIISLAHPGVLFFDELPEFRRDVLESLREPLEQHEMTIARAQYTVTFPANILFMAAMNPCPCGYANMAVPGKACTCTPYQVQQYIKKVSGPLLDRIDMTFVVPPVHKSLAQSAQTPESSKDIRARVTLAQERQQYRQSCMNSALPHEVLEKSDFVSEEADALLRMLVEGQGISHRRKHRILRVARTIADLAATPHITAEHMAEAISFAADSVTLLQAA